MKILHNMLWSTTKIDTEKKRDKEQDTTEETCIEDYVHHMEKNSSCRSRYVDAMMEDEADDFMDFMTGELCFPLIGKDIDLLDYYWLQSSTKAFNV